MLVCPSCAHENPDEQKFCGECGSNLEATPVREERKVITALFCDLVGSTALGERLDAEDISRLLRHYQRICRARIESHGGVVEKFIGDAVVGVFGVPLTHEDDPERAVRAALRISEDIGASDLGIEVRIGVNTGEALVRLDVNPRSGEGFATGDTMNTAARLEAAAPVMGVAVGAGTHRASLGAIAFEELPSISAKGKVESVEAWLALHAIARIGTEERDRTPFVGRDLELSLLSQLFDRSRSRPSTEFVSIIAEPGLGKSRLVRELARHVDQLEEFVTWREGRCLPYGDGISFWALGEIVKAQAGILESDDQPTISAKLDHVLGDADEQTRTWIKDRLAPLVGLETNTAPPERDEAFTAWRRFLEEMSAQPTVLVIEDLHWADTAFVSFLEHLAERTAGLPLLVVVTARPEVEDRHPSWPPGRRSTVLSLSPLTDGDVETLITQGLPDADPRLIGIVLDRAGGSPLFAEQLAAMFNENLLPIAGGALDETRIPSSIQALIAARIDALPPEPKRVLMEASVVGKTFWAGAVSSLGDHPDLEAALGELVRREFCRPVQPSTMEGDFEYSFWHALVRDVAYAELTKSERARLHVSVGAWFRRASSDPGEQAEIVAEHLQLALTFADHAESIDVADLRANLGIALVEAGEQAIRTDAGRSAAHMRQALGLLEHGTRLHGRASAGLGRSLRESGAAREAADAYRVAIDSYRMIGDIDAVSRLAVPASTVLRSAGLAEEANALLMEARRQFASAEDVDLVMVLCEMAKVEMTGKFHFSRAAELADEALEVAARLGVREPDGALAVRAGTLFAAGDPRAPSVMREAADAAIDAGDPVAARTHLVNLSVGISLAEGPLKGLPVLDEAIEFVRVRGLAVEEVLATRIEGLADLGRWDEVESEAPHLVTWAAEQGDGWTELVVRTPLHAIQLERGEDPHVGDLLALANEIGIERVHCVPVVAGAMLARGDRSGAVGLLEAEIPAADPEEFRYNIRDIVQVCHDADRHDLASFALESWVQPGGTVGVADRAATDAMVAASEGDVAVALPRFQAAASSFEQMGMTPARMRMLVGEARCFISMGEGQHALTTLTRAREIADGLGATRTLQEIGGLT